MGLGFHEKSTYRESRIGETSVNKVYFWDTCDRSFNDNIKSKLAVTVNVNVMMGRL